VKRPTRPDDTERNAQVQVLQDKIVEYINRQRKIKEILDSKHGGKGGTPEQQKLREKLQQLRTEWDNVLVRGRTRAPHGAALVGAWGRRRKRTCSLHDVACRPRDAADCKRATCKRATRGADARSHPTL
jgi:hypothetical protein